MPLKWSTELLARCMQDGVVKSAPGYSGLLAQVASFRSSLTKVVYCRVSSALQYWQVSTYGHIPVPLVYTQVVTLAVYVYFAVSLVGEQWIIGVGHR